MGVVQVHGVNQRLGTTADGESVSVIKHSLVF